MHAIARHLALFAVLFGAPTAAVAASADWNEKSIAWQDYEAGLAQAKLEKKPVCLVFFTTWCPHCHNYSGVFHTPEVVALAKKFVMIRLDKDKHKSISARYALDGEYIPRTYFLKASGAVLEHVHAKRDSYKFFYSEKDPASLLGGMKAALKK